MAERDARNVSEILIQAQNISKIFSSRKGNVEAVRDFSLAVHKGEVVCLVGGSGCGKTTVLNMIAGFIAPSSGRILLEGKEIRGVDPRCAMVFQSYALFPWMTVKKNISFGPRLKGIPRKTRYEQAGRWIDMVGLKGFEESYPGELSGGMRQRVALCRALANEPDVLLCDEPFAALDAMTRQLLQQELLRIVQLAGQTVLFITHSIDEAIILSDRIIVMSARPGRVKAEYENDLPHPRKLEAQLTEQFLQLKRKIWDDVEEEVSRALNSSTSQP